MGQAAPTTRTTSQIRLLVASAALAAALPFGCSSGAGDRVPPATERKSPAVDVASDLVGSYSRRGASPMSWRIDLSPGGVFFETFATCASYPTHCHGTWTVDGDDVVLTVKGSRDASLDGERRLVIVHDEDGLAGLADPGAVLIWPGEPVSSSDCFWMDARSVIRESVAARK